MSTQTQELERVQPDRGLSSSSASNPGQITDTLRNAQTRGHLVSPATSCPNLPIGTEVMFSSVLIDVNNKGEVYKIPGRSELGLSKTALNRIAKAVGISWDPVQSQRMDDGSDPHFAAYRAVGMYRHFDGSLMQVVGEKQMDLREGSATVLQIRKRQETEAKGTSEINELRRFILEHAETKARNRAIRSLGVQTSYTKEDLGKPFIVAKLMLTGRVREGDDPTGELQKVLTDNISRSMLDSNAALYGQRSEPRAIAPPPLPNNSQPQTEPANEENVDSETSEPAGPPPYEIAVGKARGTLVTEASDAELSQTIDLCAVVLEELPPGDKRAEYEEAQRQVLAEVERRQPAETGSGLKY